MTLGEKIILLRKGKNLTQEQFAEILEVSRQSVSKWESDTAYPEMNKLKEIAKFFNVSFDYLLNEDEATVVPAQEEVKEIKTNFFASKRAVYIYYSVGKLILFLILFTMPILQCEVSSVINGMFEGFTHTSYISFNCYNILGAGNYEAGNIFFLLAFFSLLLNVGLGILYPFFPNKKIKRARFITSILFPCLLVLVAAIILSNILFGCIMLTIIAFADVIIFHFLEKKYLLLEEPKKAL